MALVETSIKATKRSCGNPWLFRSWQKIWSPWTPQRLFPSSHFLFYLLSNFIDSMRAEDRERGSQGEISRRNKQGATCVFFPTGLSLFIVVSFLLYLKQNHDNCICLYFLSPWCSGSICSVFTNEFNVVFFFFLFFHYKQKYTYVSWFFVFK